VYGFINHGDVCVCVCVCVCVTGVVYWLGVRVSLMRGGDVRSNALCSGVMCRGELRVGGNVCVDVASVPSCKEGGSRRG